MPLILGANSVSGGYNIANSLRFNSGSSDYLNRTFGSPTNNKIFTFSFWIKRGDLAREQFFFNGAGASQFYINNEDKLYYYDQTAGGTYKTTQVFRDVSAWYHIVVAEDTTQATAGNRVKIYVNGTQVSAFDIQTNPTQNNSSAWNANATAYYVGRYNPSPSGYYWNGYMSEMYFIDGQQLDPSYFGETDTPSGIWIPKAYTGSFGTNGFYLKFANSASLGVDSSGNGNNFTVNNLTSVDQSTDTPTNNFCTLNPLSNNNASLAFTNGNLEGTSSTSWLGSISTLAVSQGKWYWEVKYISGNFGFGIGKIGTSATATVNLSSPNNGYAGKYPDGYEYFRNGANSQKINNNSSSSYGTQASANDILMVAFNADIGAIWVGRNGTWYASATQGEIEAGTTTNAMFSGITINDFFAPSGSFENGALQYNFGNPPYSGGGYTDGEGYGNFSYAVPSGYYSLCTKNLANYG